MWRSSLLVLLALLAANASRAAEQPKSGQEFEAVPAPQLDLQAPDLDKKPPPETPKPETIPQPSPEKPAPSGSALPADVWDRISSGIEKELNAVTPPSDGGSSSEGQSPATRTTGTSMMRGIAALCVVLALILICYYVVNRYGKKSPLLAGPGLGRILGRIYLSPKAELYFVRVKDRVLVVGVTANEISRVAEFDATLFEETRSAPAPSEGPSEKPSGFAKELRAQTLAGPTTNALSEEIAALKADLDRAQQYFRETTRDTGAR